MDKDNKAINRQKILDRLIELNPDVDAKKIDKALDTLFDEIALALICGDRVEIRGFGSLVVRKRESGEARNPKSGARVQVADRGSLYFRASRELIKVLNEALSNDNEVKA
jgi:integration host factor subunit beta